MRVIMPALVAMLLLPNMALAQTLNPYVIPHARAPRDPLPRFTIAPRGSPLGRIGLPLPSIGLQPPDSHLHGREHQQHGFFVPWPMMVFYVPQPVATPAPPPEPMPKAVEQPPPMGRLVLDVQPPGTQVFADGYYVGVPEDFSALRGGGLLEAGTHRIDLSAAGFEPWAVDVRVTAGQSVTYRAVLKPLPPREAVPPSTFYLIPGCYMGNIPPHDAQLPATCDKNRAIVWRP
jgi:PEGA domain